MTSITPLTPSQLTTLSRPSSPLQVAWATFIKNLQIARRYLPNLLGGLVEIAIRAAFFMLMANAVSLKAMGVLGRELSGRELFIFFQGSLLLFIFTRSTLWGPINAVSNDLYNGTLEYLYSLPASRYAYYVGTVLAEVAQGMIVFLPLYLLLVITSQASLLNMLMVLLAGALTLAALTCLGILIALLALVWRQVGSIASVLGILFELLAGAYLPVTAFPLPVQYLAYLLPYTWGYDLVRYYALSGRWPTLLPVWQEWTCLAVFGLVYLALSRYLLGKAELMAKKTGLHII